MITVGNYAALFSLYDLFGVGPKVFLAGTVSCRIAVENINELFSEHNDSGVLYSPDTVISETAWGTREFPTVDLHCNLLTLYEPFIQ